MSKCVIERYYFTLISIEKICQGKNYKKWLSYFIIELGKNIQVWNLIVSFIDSNH